MPLYGLYTSPVSLSCSILIAEKLCCGISKRTWKARDGRGFSALWFSVQSMRGNEYFTSNTNEDVNDPRKV